jgi:hypothetical protein
MRDLINGVPVTFATTEEAEGCEFLVCVEWTTPPLFRDNIRSTCGGCGTPLQHRPYAPRKPMRVCVECAISRANHP